MADSNILEKMRTNQIYGIHTGQLSSYTATVRFNAVQYNVRKWGGQNIRDTSRNVEETHPLSLCC